jgi:hypothetical protein
MLRGHRSPLLSRAVEPAEFESAPRLYALPSIEATAEAEYGRPLGVT